jgi:hypothetical protein
MSSAVRVWTSDRLVLSEEGNAEGLDRVITVLEEVSMRSQLEAFIS